MTDTPEMDFGWDEIRSMKPSTLTRHLTDLSRSVNGSPRILRERLAAAVGADIPEPDPYTVWQAITHVKAAIGAVGKDRKVTEGPAKYAYRGIDAILDAAHDAIVTAGLVIVPEQVAPTYESRQTRNGAHSQWVTLRVRWRIYGPTGDFITAATIGEAADTSDKATNKAHTAAWKVLLSELFAIPYSADEQDEHRPEAGAPVSGDELRARAEAERARHARANTLQESLENLPGELYDKAVERMTASALKAGAKVDSYATVDQLGEGSTLDSWLDAWDKLLVAAWAKAETAPHPAEDVPETDQ